MTMTTIKVNLTKDPRYPHHKAMSNMAKHFGCSTETIRNYLRGQEYKMERVRREAMRVRKWALEHYICAEYDLDEEEKANS